MSAIGGVADFENCQGNWDDRLLPSITALDRGLTWLGPDGSDTICMPPVAMILRSFHTTLESFTDQQPRQSGKILITLDGRLDNLSQLRQSLDCGRTAPQTEVVESAYRRWDTECFKHLVGDFAIALWDGEKRKLILARDPFGTRLLYYGRKGGRLLWGSLADAVLKAMPSSLEVNRQYVGAFLLWEEDPLLSPLNLVNPVPPGQFVALQAERTDIVKFWSIWDHVRDQPLRRDSDYEEEFRLLMFNSVRNRLRADRPVVAELSGGLDSSSIVCIADTLLNSDSVVTSRLTTLSYVYDRAWRSDEREFIHIVEKHRATPGIHIREDDVSFLDRVMDPAFVSFPNPVLLSGGFLMRILEAMKQANARVLLSGIVGDHVLMGEETVPLELADLLEQGQLFSLLRRLKPWSHATGVPVVGLLWEAAIRPCLKRWIGNSRPNELALSRIPSWFHPRLRQEITEAGRSNIKKAEALFSPSKTRFCASIESAIGTVASGRCGCYTTLGRFEKRFPYLDRPLVEFLAAIPTGQLYRPTVRRSIQRRALAGILPKEIAQRTTKGDPAHAIAIAFNHNYEVLRELISHSLVCEREYADQRQLLVELDRLRNGVARGAAEFLRLISTEVWFRALDNCTTQVPKEARIGAEQRI